jgi:hypothetical protein
MVVLAYALELFCAAALVNKTSLQNYLREDQKESIFNIALQVSFTSKFFIR